MNNKKAILVTWDFTPISEAAFFHGLKIARTVDHTLRLLHIVKPGDELQVQNSQELLRKDALRLKDEHAIEIEPVVLVGDIFNAVSKYTADNPEVAMVIMGTHGIKGKQKYFGSYALRVVVGAPVPFVVVQDKPLNMERFANIVFPIDFKSENKEKLQWAIFLGKYFNCRVHLFKSPVSDPSLAKKVNTNLNFAIRFIIQNNLEYEIHTATKSGSFLKEMMEFSKNIEADLILITTTKHITFLDYLFGAPEQYIMANASRIPVMVVNPKATYAKMGQFMFGST
jgi:nucleotide-binding universal stress UspA family protein